MGNTSSSYADAFKSKIDYSTCFRIDRVFDAGCDFLNNENISVGILHNIDENNKNPYKYQGIRLGNNRKIECLTNFIKNDNSYTYEFENNIKLNIFKKDGHVYYNINTRDINITKPVNNILCKMYKPIQSCSDEIDMIYDIYNKNN